MNTVPNWGILIITCETAFRRNPEVFHTWHILDAGSVSSITKYYYFRYFIETLNIFGASYCHEDQDDN